MVKSLFVNSVGEQIKLEAALRNVTDVSEAIAVLEHQVAAEPSDWLLWYMLADYYSRVHEYARAVQAAQRCYALQPEDPRSAFSLASSLRLLTWAKYNTPERRAQVEQLAAAYDLTADDTFNPAASQQALDELGTTIEEAAEWAMRLFAAVLGMVDDPEEQEAVSSSLQAMQLEFPNLPSR